MSHFNSFFTYSFGCRVNMAEKEQIDKQMTAAGFFQNESKPDIYIINTCSVTHKAEREARQLIYQIKKKLPKAKIVITGCSATYWLKTGKYNDLPIDLITDNLQKEYLVQLIKKQLLNNVPLSDGRLRVVSNKNEISDKKTDKFLSSGRFMVKIQDGCHRFCSFCIVPYLRGLPISRTISEIISLINENSQIKEAILTAINTEAFGKDTNESFLELVKVTLNRTKISRLSFGSVHPWSLTDEFLEFYKNNCENERLVHFFHIPLQSGSNKILQLMKRVHTREDMMMRVKQITAINETAFISTDVIVGFLEETDVDFQDTYEFLAKSPISKFHVFRFSKRELTASFYLAKRLKEPDEKTKIRRAKLLRDLSEVKYEAFKKSLLGYRSQALFLSPNGSQQEALLNNQIPVCLQKSGFEPGNLKTVEVVKYKNKKLFGRIIN